MYSINNQSTGATGPHNTICGREDYKNWIINVNGSYWPQQNEKCLNGWNPVAVFKCMYCNPGLNVHSLITVFEFQKASNANGLQTNI